MKVKSTRFTVRGMHILMLSDVYFPRINGVSTSIQTFSASFLASGHQVTLIAPAYPTDFEADMEVIRIPSRRLPFDPEDRLMSLRAIKRLVPELSGHGFDLIHIQTPFVAHYAGVYLGKALGLPTVASYHTFFEAYFEKYLPWVPRGWLRSVARLYSRRQCNEVNAVVSPSRQMLSKLREYGVTTSARVIPTGLPEASFNSTGHSDFRRKHGLPGEAFVLLYVGRVAHEKNIEFLIDMFETLCDEHADMVLLIAGEGPAQPSLRARAARGACRSRVRFLGYLDRHTELAACYRASDVFVFASETETQGLVLLEAMAVGLPVVSVASMGSLDVLTDGEGCRISPLESRAFADLVSSIYRDHEHARTLSEKGIRYARQWSAAVKSAEMMALYQELIQGSSEVRQTAPGELETAP